MKQFTRSILCLALFFMGQTAISQTVFRGVVIDKATNTPIPNAKVGVTGQGVGEITNELGKFVYRKYHKILSEQSTLKVSARGYKTLSNNADDIRTLMNNRGAVYLEKSNNLPSVASKKVDKIQVFWDASKANGHRNIKKESNFLINYIRENAITQVLFIAFNSKIIASETLTVSASFESDLNGLLNTISYEGVSDYDLVSLADADGVVIVAANKPSFGTFNVNQKTPVHVIRTNQNKDDAAYFEKLCAYTSGNYFSPQKQQAQEDSIPKETFVTGIVEANGLAIQNATLMRLGSLKEYVTNAKGEFTLPAISGDVIIIRHLGMFPMDLEVTKEKEYTITLRPKTEVLEEVQLSKKVEKPAYNFNEKKQLDVVEGRTVPIRSIYKEDFKSNALNISDLINGRFGIVSNNDSGRIMTAVKGRCTKFYVDGVETIPELILISQIEHISVYHAYGSVLPCAARIVVTTRLHPDSIDKKFNSLGITRRTNNIYAENVPVLNTNPLNDNYFQKNKVSGTVKVNGFILKGASVLLLGSLKEVETNGEGQFSINASQGDILEIKHLGMHPKTVVIEDASDLTINLVLKNEILEEVILTEKAKKPLPPYDHFIPETRMEVINGIKHDIKFVFYKKDLNKAGTDIYEMLRSTHPRIGFDENSSGMRTLYLKKGRGKSYMRVIVDGFYVSVATVSPLLVERVSISTSGAVIITTRNNPNIRKQFLDENGIKASTKVYEEEVIALQQYNTQYFAEREIRGLISVNNIPLQGVSIIKQGDLNEVLTTIDGAFKVNVDDGDVLEIKHLGMHPKTVLITEEDFYNIELIAKFVILNEVVLAEEKEKEKKRFVTTAYGDKDRKAVGYAVDDQLSKFVSPADLSFSQVALKIPGVLLDPGTNKLFFQRSLGAIVKSEIMIVLDGGIVSQSTLNNIDPQTITNITALKGAASTIRYGSQAFGGALLITTKANTGYAATAHKPDLRIKNNTYDEQLPELSFDAINTDYIDDVTKERSINIKLENYRKLKRSYRNKVDFYVDMALYFQRIDVSAAAEVRDDFALLARNNVKALRVLAYLYESANANVQAQKIYERIVAMDPGNPQSYRDLALVFQENGEYNNALELYINMLGDKILGVDFSQLYPAISNELQRLVGLHKNKIDYQRLSNDWLAVGFNVDVRITLAWSDANAPFEFQFVNPENKFYNWNSKGADGDYKIPMEEFIVDDAPSGKWLVNIRYTGFEDEISIPPYLKYTVYKNYGTVKEEKQIKLVRLDKQIDKVTLDSFIY